MSNQLKSIAFASVLCLVCSVMLTAASTGLKSFQQRNMAADRQKNILKAFGIVGDDQHVSAQQIESLFQQKVKKLSVTGEGRIKETNGQSDESLPLYAQMENGKMAAYVVPINTRGLWGKIHGYLAIENDGATIRGFTVYKHSETPGLGGVIESRWFCKNFKNKKIVNAEGSFVSIGIAKGAAEEAVPPARQMNYVDGVSGATLTGKFLSSGLKDILTDYEPMAIEFRQKNPLYLRPKTGG